MITDSHKRWLIDDGDNTHAINYNLDENSNIIDLGGYSGIWVNQMIKKYNSNFFIIEPIPRFFNGMVDKFSKNNKVKLLNVGVSNENKKGSIFLSGDMTSTNISNGKKIDVDFNTIDVVLNKFGLQIVDLMQINIEGDEYELLEYMIENKLLGKFKNIQIQFHKNVVQNDINRRKYIQSHFLKNGFKNTYNYDFVWESWSSE